MVLRYFLKALALPPVLNILLILIALWGMGRWPRLRNAVITLSTLSLLLLSLPITAGWLASLVETYPALDMERQDFSHYQAIVILGSGRYSDAPEYGGQDVPRAIGLERLRYGARLHKHTGLPVLVTGGKWEGEDSSEAEFMAAVLRQDFNVEATWQEMVSRTTWENAQYSKRIAEDVGFNRIVLVTHAWHMARAVYSFEHVDFEVLAAPTVFYSLGADEVEFQDWLPSIAGLQRSVYILHELLGRVWYRLGEGN